MNCHLSHAISHNQPPVILQQDQVNALLPLLDVKNELTAMFRSLGQNHAVQPPQTLTLLPQDAGDFITYSGAMAEQEVFGAKLSPYLITETAPVITAWTSLMSQRTGQPLLWCDSALLTAERTAGTTALAVDYLAKVQSRELAIIGSGAIALAHLRHVKNLRQWQSIRVYSPSLANDEKRRAAFTAIDERVVFCTSSEHCIAGADVVMLCTSSGTPVVTSELLSPGVLVTSISTNVANAHEVSPSLLLNADVYCDYKATTPDSAGEMVLAETELSWNKKEIKGDLPDLVNANCPLPDFSKAVFFRSIGLGLEDIAMAYGLWKLLQNQQQ
ncbi:ornithine cyclodeaminase family protein [Thalassomonas actiniarum]|uniref:Ornithine cyclodeaminase family protein n=1 Tax=Thalassomonas actiniarum TaxID=485447 RepID=A0AAF0C257_9GAMM|nr:ornithine cyclodeaminase family protein [Thalassomonas actiniarum]WDD97673.1 ornithine cyclodeaminase family protein [Thalassomonas actiniarum]